MLSPQTQVVCPYCYEAFGEREIEFRCAGRIPRSGTACAPAIDELHRTRLGRQLELPRTFASDGRRPEAACPECHMSTTIQVCPRCHSRLPVHFGKVSGRLIALVGARETGKTIYMTVLVRELNHRVGERFDTSISGADDSTRHRFLSDYERPLYESGKLIGTTRPADGYGREPLVFRFTRTHRLGPTARVRHTLLSFFDTAGEDMTSQNAVETNARYLANADGVLLILDPLQMPGARGLAGDGARLPHMARPQDVPANVLARVTDELLRSGRKGAAQRVDKPLAVVFTKLDALWHALPEGSPLRRGEPGGAYFDDSDSQDVHAQVQGLLHTWNGGAVDQFVRNHYRRYRYFGVSALGESPANDSTVSPHGVLPHRVADPFLWLLAGFGAIPVRRK